MRVAASRGRAAAASSPHHVPQGGRKSMRYISYRQVPTELTPRTVAS